MATITADRLREDTDTMNTTTNRRAERKALAAAERAAVAEYERRLSSSRSR